MVCSWLSSDKFNPPINYGASTSIRTRRLIFLYLFSYLSVTLSLVRATGTNGIDGNEMASCLTEPRRTAFALARVLLVDDDPASRLALQTVLQAGGYEVESAASAAEAIGKLALGEYELVLSDLSLESREAGRRVLAHAQITPYKPATAFISTTYKTGTAKMPVGGPLLIASEDLPGLLTKVAELIGARARRRAARVLRQTSA